MIGADVSSDQWQDILQPLGLAAGGLVLAGLGLNYVIARRTKRAKEEAEEKEA